MEMAFVEVINYIPNYIPKRTIGSEMPVFGTYDAAFDEELRPYIDNLNKACGLVESKAVSRLAKKLMEEKV